MRLRCSRSEENAELLQACKRNLRVVIKAGGLEMGSYVRPPAPPPHPLSTFPTPVMKHKQQRFCAAISPPSFWVRLFFFTEYLVDRSLCAPNPGSGKTPNPSHLPARIPSTSPSPPVQSSPVLSVQGPQYIVYSRFCPKLSRRGSRSIKKDGGGIKKCFGRPLLLVFFFVFVHLILLFSYFFFLVRKGNFGKEIEGEVWRGYQCVG